jgi:hypothetical protein
MELIIIALIAVEVVIVRFVSFGAWLDTFDMNKIGYCRLSFVTAQSFGICFLDLMKERRRRRYILEDWRSALLIHTHPIL